VEIRTSDDATKFLESVHHFHDGFIQTVVLTSDDSFDITEPTLKGVGHLCTGDFRVEIIFMHHPTIAGLPPKRLASRCTFIDVTHFCLNLRDFQAAEWPLLDVSINADPASSRLRLTCSWNRLSSNGEWTTRTEDLLSFSRAFVEEV
jgi:hypothetical protein